MPRSLHLRAAAIASSSVSPATNRRDILRVELFDTTQWANPGLSDSFRSIDRSMGTLGLSLTAVLRGQFPLSPCALRGTFRRPARPCSPTRPPLPPAGSDDPARR